MAHQDAPFSIYKHRLRLLPPRNKKKAVTSKCTRDIEKNREKLFFCFPDFFAAVSVLSVANKFAAIAALICASVWAGDSGGKLS